MMLWVNFETGVALVNALQNIFLEKVVGVEQQQAENAKP